MRVTKRCVQNKTASFEVFLSGSCRNTVEMTLLTVEIKLRRFREVYFMQAIPYCNIGDNSGLNWWLLNNFLAFKESASFYFNFDLDDNQNKGLLGNEVNIGAALGLIQYSNGIVETRETSESGSGLLINGLEKLKVFGFVYYTI